MAVLLRELYYKIGPKYRLRLIAGKKELFNLVDWVQIVENSNLISFQRENELVIATGVSTHEEEELLSFCRQLHDKDISGLILNIGPYIRSVSPRIISYCDEAGFPLFALPWEVRLVDIMHDMGRFILKREQIEDNLSEAIQNAIFSPEEKEVYTKILEKNGFRKETGYSLAALALTGGRQDQMAYYTDLVTGELAKEIDRVNTSFVSFARNRRVYLVAADYTEAELDSVGQSLASLRKKYSKQVRLNAVVSPRNLPVESLSDYYGRLNVMLDLAAGKDRGIVEYGKEAVYSLLLAVKSKDELTAFYRDTYGRLAEYDKANHTECCALLKQYFKLDGSIQKLAGLNFVHRNTVSYQLKKIEKICRVDLENWEDRLKIHLGILIGDLL